MIKLKVPLKEKTPSELSDILEFLNELITIITYYPNEKKFQGFETKFRKIRMQVYALLSRFFDAKAECEHVLKLLKEERETFALQENKYGLCEILGIENPVDQEIASVSSWLKKIQNHLH